MSRPIDRAPRRRLIARLPIIAAVAVAALAGSFLALPLLIDVNQYRGVIQSKAQEALGREVTLGEMSLSLLPSFGIRVERPEVEGLLRAEALTVSVRVFRLLFSQTIDVTRVVLERPEITIVRAADGSWNFQRMGPDAGAPQATPDAAAPARPFSLSKLAIRDGQVRLLGPPVGSRAPVALDFEIDLDASASGSGAGDLKAALSGSLSGGDMDVEISGDLVKTLDATDLDLSLDRASIDVQRARELTRLLGQTWPVPEGLLESRSLELAGHVEARVEKGVTQRIALTDLTVKGAKLRLARDHSGVWNYETLAGGEGTGRPAAGGGSALEVRNLRLEGATIALHDEAVPAGPSGAKRVVDLELEEVACQVEELAAGRPVRLSLEAKVRPGDGALRVSGSAPASLEPPAGPEGTSQPVDLAVDLVRIGAAPIAPYLDALIGMAPESGTVTASIKLKGKHPDQVNAAGSLALEDLRPWPSASPINATAQLDLTAKRGWERIEIDQMQIATGGSRISLKGRLQTAGERTLADIELLPASMQAADLAALLVLGGLESDLAFSSPEPVRLQARMKGDLNNRDQLDLTGTLEATSMTLRHPAMSQPLEQVKGKVALRKGGLDVTGLSAVIGKTDLAGTLSLDGLGAPSAPTNIRFDLTSRHADFAELVSLLRADDKPAAASGAAGAAGSGGDWSAGLDRVVASGRLAIAQGSFDTVGFTDLDASLALEGKRLRLDPLSMKAYGGTMSGAAGIDLGRKPAAYTVSARTQQIDSDALLAANLGLEGTLTGRLAADVTVSATGGGREEILKSARGSGDVRIQDGRVGALNVLKVLSRASGLLGERSLQEVSGRLAEQGTEFSVLDAKLEVRDGKIFSKGLSLRSPDLVLTDDGDLDMLSGKIRIAGQVVFSEALSQAMVQEGSQAADYFWDSKRATVILPLTLSGPIGSPSPSIDWSSAGGRLARRKVEEKVLDRLGRSGLADLVRGAGGSAPVRSAAPSNPAPAPPPGSGQLEIAIEEKGFSGNLLLPDLKIKGTLKGTDITEATIKISDKAGRLLHEESVTSKVNKYYATHDRAAPASINFRVSVEGKKLVAAKGIVQVMVEARDGLGGRAEKSFTVSR